MKKSYIQPSIKAFPIVKTEIICGSGKASESLGFGSGNQPTGNGTGIITTESKESFLDDEEYDVEW